MEQIDLHRLALRLKIMEILQSHLRKKRLQDAPDYWRRLIRAN